MQHDFDNALRRLARARLRYEDAISSNASLAERAIARDQLHEARLAMAYLRSQVV